MAAAATKYESDSLRMEIDYIEVAAGASLLFTELLSSGHGTNAHFRVAVIRAVTEGSVWAERWVRPWP